MARTYEIFNKDDLYEMVDKIDRYQDSLTNDGKPYKAMNITVKSYRKPKTSEQHRTYWLLIGKVKDALREIGTVLNEDALHEYFKRESGFTKMIEMPNGKSVMVSCSISDESEEATRKNLSFLIEFILQWAAENLGLTLNINGRI